MASLPELSTLQLGGYDYDYVDSPPESLTCPVCLLPFRDPHMLDCCGAKYCEVCISRVKAAGQPCPLCKQYFNSLLDREKQRNVLSLRVYCSKKKLWCVWQGELRHLDKHEKEECGWELVECRHQCGKPVPLRHLSQHEEECSNRSVSNSSQDGLMHSIETKLALERQHHSHEMASMRDEFEKRLEQQKRDYETKLEQLRQEVKEVIVPQCVAMYQRRDQNVSSTSHYPPGGITNHYPPGDNSTSHYPPGGITSPTSQYPPGGITSPTSQYPPGGITSPTSQYPPGGITSPTSQYPPGGITSPTSQYPPGGITSPTSQYPPGGITSPTSRYPSGNVTSHYPSGSVTTSHYPSGSSTSHYLSGSSTSHYPSGSVTSSSHYLPTNANTHYLPCEFTMSKYFQLKATSEMWYSPPFHTQPYGYKLYLAVYANGSGGATGKYLSVFLDLMKGEHDDNLPWPFQGRITFQLLNQKENANHISWTADFSQWPTCGARVVDEERANRRVGNPKFIPHSHLNDNAASRMIEYLQDDCLKWKVHFY